MKRVPQIAVCIVVLSLLLGWVDTIATASAQTASVQVTADSVEVAVDPGAVIGEAFAQEQIGKAIEKSMEDMSAGPSPLGVALISIVSIIGLFIAPVLMV